MSANFGARLLATVVTSVEGARDAAVHTAATPEARHEAVRANRRRRVLQRFSEAFWMLLTAVGIVPLFFAFVLVFLSRGGGASLGALVFGHLSDDCDQPLGLMMISYWSSVLLLAVLALLLQIDADCCARCCARRCPLVREVLKAMVKVLVLAPIALFWLAWPFVTLFYALASISCSGYLLGQAWTVLAFYGLAFLIFTGYALWPFVLAFAYEHRLLRDPGQVAVASCRRVAFDEAQFAEGGEGARYPGNCPVCFEDFCANEEIVVTPCAGDNHVFHKECLARWLRTSRTCPLCRGSISGRQAAATPQATAAEGSV